jgi:hypothetical protein
LGDQQTCSACRLLSVYEILQQSQKLHTCANNKYSPCVLGHCALKLCCPLVREVFRPAMSNSNRNGVL